MGLKASPVPVLIHPLIVNGLEGIAERDLKGCRRPSRIPSPDSDMRSGLDSYVLESKGVEGVSDRRQSQNSLAFGGFLNEAGSS